jgi:predicted phage-related endonuclease
MFTNPQPVALEIPQLQPWIELYDIADVRMKAAELERDRAINNMKLLMGDNCEEAVCGNRHPRWKTQTRNQFDATRFKQDYPDLYGAYLKPSTFRRFNLSQEN